MSTTAQSLFELAARELGVFLDPLVEACSSPERLFAFFAERGWNLEGLLGADLTTITTAVDAVQTTLEGVSAGGGSDSLDGIADLLAAFAGGFDGIRNLKDSVLGLGAPGSDASVLEALAADLLEYLVLWYAAARVPAMVQAARVLTIVDDQLAPALTSPSGDIVRFPLYRPTLRLDNVAQLLRDPIGHLKQAYVPQAGVATEADARVFADALFPRLEILACALGATARAGLSGATGADLLDAANGPLQRMMTFLFPIGPTGPPVSDDSPGVQASVGATVAVIPASGTASFGPQGPGLEIDPVGMVTFTVPLGRWTLTIEVAGQVGQMFVSAGALRFADPNATTVDLSVSLARDGGQGPAFLIGAASGTRLEIGSFQLSGEAHFHGQQPDFGVLVEVGSAAFVISGGDGDGFLQKILPQNLRIAFDLAVGWSRAKGVYFRGSAGIEATLPLHVDLFGVLKIDSVYIAILLKNSDLRVVVALSAGLQLGPVAAAVERMGLAADITFPAGGGNLGPADAALKFKPPTGAGMAVDATVVVGGGYLYFDEDNEQYAGVLQLEIQRVIAIKAIGLLTTRMPDGSKGFSLLVILTAEFPPIQLGYGFTLNGLGGLAGVNRTMVLDVLRSGIKNHSVDSILFPEDPVAHAPQLLSELRSIFPPAEGRFVLGPMAKLGWGSGILILELGIIIELPSPVRLAILGQLMLALPQPKSAVALIKMDVLGTIDFDKSDASIDATLFDSQVAGFPITGDMAMRLNWGPSPVFIVSVGGLNPRCQAPPGFPVLDRLGIALANGDNPRLRLESYFALTSNTLQFGARLEAFAQIDAGLLGKFSASAELGFDAVIEPFKIALDVYGAAAIKHDGKPILQASLSLTLTGPTPWHVSGSAEFDFLGKHRIPIDFTIGDQPPPPPLPPADPLPDLRAALADPRNWSAQLPGGGHMLVTLRRIEVPDTLLAHPLGDLSVRQRVVPLEVEIARYSGAPVSGDRVFHVAKVLLDGTEAGSGAAVKDQFAPAQFFAMSDDEKLARPAFEPFPAGRQVSMAGIRSGTSLAAGFGYETVVIDDKEALSSHAAGAYTIAGEIALVLAAQGAAGQSRMRATGAAKFAGPSQAVILRDPEYAVTSTDTLAVGQSSISSYTEADTARRAQGGGWQVVGSHEAA